MTCIIDTKSRRHLSAKLAAGLAISAFLVLGTFVASASAAEHGGGGHGGGGHARRWPWRRWPWRRTWRRGISPWRGRRVLLSRPASGLWLALLLSRRR